MKCLGIDFGTENTKVAFFDSETNEVLSIPFQNSVEFMPYFLPSVIFFNEVDLPKYYGATALEAGKNKPNLLVNKIKRVIGKTYEEVKEDRSLAEVGYELIAGVDVGNRHEVKVRVGTIHKKEYFPEEIVAMILHAALVEASLYLRENKGWSNLDYDWVVVTYPAHFCVVQVSKLRDAAVKEGFDIEKLKLISEPTATVFDAVFNGKIPDVPYDTPGVLVLNIGSDTIDAALVKLEPPSGTCQCWKAMTAAVGENSALGGTAIDIAIVNWILEQIRKNPDVDINMFSKAGKQKLRFNAEDAKVALSEGRCQRTRVVIPGFEASGPMLDVNILNHIISPTVSEFIATFNHILERNKIKDSDYQYIILTGETTSIPLLHNSIISEFAAPLYTCPCCGKRLRATRPDRKFLSQTKGLAIKQKATAATDAWLYTHDLNSKNKFCYDHLIFQNGDHFELGTADVDNVVECFFAGRFSAQSRNQVVLDEDYPTLYTARGAAVSASKVFSDTVINSPLAIRLLVKGELTPSKIVQITSKQTCFPCFLYEALSICPEETSLEINIIQDTPETKINQQTQTVSGIFNLWGKTTYMLTPTKNRQRIYIGFYISSAEGSLEVYVFEDEAALADWLVNAGERSASRFLFRAKTERIIIDEVDSGGLG